mmetsp:Transcript_17277/g.31978  ORF Transcript_17277/g.31978 Transcript_17277/m.31978 type:complete len:334 (-) Transcript_17277:72-1073(-)
MTMLQSSTNSPTVTCDVTIGDVVQSSDVSLNSEDVAEGDLNSTVSTVPSPVRGVARAWSNLRAKQMEQPDASADEVELLQKRLRAAEERLAAAEQRADSSEQELGVLKSATGFMVSLEGASELAGLQSALASAHKKTSAFWDLAATRIEPVALRELQVKDAAWRLEQQVKLEEQRRDQIWETLRASVDVSALTELARAMGGGPVIIARRLFDVNADLAGGASDRKHTASPMRRASQPEIGALTPRAEGRTKRSNSVAITSASQVPSDSQARAASRPALPPRPRTTPSAAGAAMNLAAPEAPPMPTMVRKTSIRDGSPSVKDRIRELETSGRIA